MGLNFRGLMPAKTRPLGQLDTNYRWDPDSYGDETFRGEYDANNNLIYKGFARPGSDTSEPVWQINKLTYDANSNLLKLEFPQNAYAVASANYEFAWDDRALYNYS